MKWDDKIFAYTMGRTGIETRCKLAKYVGESSFTKKEATVMRQCYWEVMRSGRIPEEARGAYSAFIDVLTRTTPEAFNECLVCADYDLFRHEQIIRLFRQVRPNVVAGKNTVLDIREPKPRNVKVVV